MVGCVNQIDITSNRYYRLQKSCASRAKTVLLALYKGSKENSINFQVISHCKLAISNYFP